MSKAFVKETDELEDLETIQPTFQGKNYMTPSGFAKLKQELGQLLNKERPELTATVAWAASNGDRSENADYLYGKKKLREIDRRIRFLTKRLESAEVVDPATMQSDRVFFGATVTVEDEDGTQKTYTIVGVDEIELSKNRISWISPLATAMLKKRVGEIISFRSPKGVRELEIIAIQYQSL